MLQFPLKIISSSFTKVHYMELPLDSHDKMEKKDCSHHPMYPSFMSQESWVFNH